MLESKFQAELICEIENLFPGCLILKNDPTHIQGIPDLTILYKNKWAVLESKRTKKAKKQPNQEHYITKLNEMSFARFICPENKEEVIGELQQTFRHRRVSRLSKSE